MMKRSILPFILLIFILGACSSVHKINVDTYNPSAIIFPKKVDKVLIVNNAVAQPQDIGCEFSLFGVNQDTCRLVADSALFDACKGLGEKILEEDYFGDVLLFHEPTRKDNTFYLDTKLTKEQVTELCDETGADAVISIDRMVFGMKKEVTNMNDGTIVGIIKVDVSGVVRGYIPERDNSLASVIVSDSVFFAEGADNLPILNAFLPDVTTAVREAAKFFGGRLYQNFVPHWKTERRWYYSQMGNYWQEGSALASVENWEYAAEKWKHIYDKSKRWKSKAKAASNIALAYEMKDNLDKALEWATVSVDLYEKANDKDSDYRKLQDFYVKELTARILNKHKLKVQFDEK